jgi:HEAT repeat protein
VAEINIQVLIEQLEDRDRQTRQRARRKLIRAGDDAIPFLEKAIQSDKPSLRWQAGKALCQIDTPEVIPVLIDILRENEYVGVRWQATEGLIKMGETGLVPLLQSLTEHFDSIWLRESAHHILHTLHDQGIETEAIEKTLNALEGSEPGSTVAQAAEEALKQMRKKDI